MRTVIIAALALVVVACVKEVKRDIGQPVTVQREVSCEYAGLCYSCGGVTFNGKSTCGYGIHPNCDGHQSAEMQVTPITIHYDDGSSYSTEQTQIIRRLDSCR